MAPAKQSIAATFRNIPARTMAPAILASAATFRNNAGPYHAGARFSGRLHILKCLHLRPNSRQHLAPRNCTHIVAHGRAHIGSNSRAHVVATIRGNIGNINARQTFGQLATFKAATSRQHLRPSPVGNNNPGARLFTFKAANPRMIRGLYGKQFFIPRTISIAYLIRNAYRSARNDKKNLSIVQMYYYAGRRIAAWTSP
jgi:hypothetical protein